MAKKKVIKVGDRVLLEEDKDLSGVVVYQQYNSDKWCVHWNNPHRYMKRDRGLYTSDQLIKDMSFNKKNKEVEHVG